MAKYTIWVDRNAIASNKTRGEARLPVFRVRGPEGLHRASTVRLLGASQMRYDVDGGTKCGASAWIETDDEVEMTP